MRDRKEDIPALTEHFLGHIYPDRQPFKISPKAEGCFQAYHWPGNVRELRNVIERAIILSENDLIAPGNLPEEIVRAFDGTVAEGVFPTLEQSERQLILRVLNHVKSNRTVAAKMLGIGRKTLYRKMCKFNLPQ